MGIAWKVDGLWVWLLLLTLWVRQFGVWSAVIGQIMVPDQGGYMHLPFFFMPTEIPQTCYLFLKISLGKVLLSHLRGNRLGNIYFIHIMILISINPDQPRFRPFTIHSFFLQCDAQINATFTISESYKIFFCTQFPLHSKKMSTIYFWNNTKTDLFGITFKIQTHALSYGHAHFVVIPYWTVVAEHLSSASSYSCVSRWVESKSRVPLTYDYSVNTPICCETTF